MRWTKRDEYLRPGVRIAAAGCAINSLIRPRHEIGQTLDLSSRMSGVRRITRKTKTVPLALVPLTYRRCPLPSTLASCCSD